MIGILLAAGRGTRMKSVKPKVLFDINDEPMCFTPFRALFELCERVVVVVGYRGADVKAALTERGTEVFGAQVFQSKTLFFTQDPPNGTGDAVKVALAGLGKGAGAASEFLIVNGDLPLIRKSTLERLLKNATDQKLEAACLSTHTRSPHGLGRILRDQTGVFKGIREEKDANTDEKRISEINGGVYFFKGSYLRDHVESLKSANSQNEFYLTDLLLPRDRGTRTEALLVRSPWDLMGVNTTFELTGARKVAQLRLQKKLCEDFGVDFLEPTTTLVSARATFEGACRVGPGVSIEGKCLISAGVILEGHVLLSNSRVAENAQILWGSVVEDSVVGADSSVGPMAHLRPGTELGRRVKIGNFVELKKTKMGDDAKASHLAYLGDADVGSDSNVGCGTITCNYDGFQKHKTVIGKRAFIGSDTQLIAPIVIGDNAYVGSGTTVTTDVPAGALALSRAEMVIKPGYANKLSEKLAAKKEKK